MRYVGVERPWELESYFIFTVQGVDYIARIRVDRPGVTWIHRGSLWVQLAP